MTVERRKQIMQAIGQKAKEITPKGSEVILFGSQARGDARPDSDWDVLILLDKDKVTSDDMDEYSFPLRELGWDYNECINALLFTKKEWRENIASPFYENVEQDGIRLWVPPHTHEGNSQQFGLHFIKGGLVSRDLGKFYSQLFEMRLKGDYSDRFGLTEEDVVPKIQPTESFIKTISNMAKTKLGI